MFFRLSVFKKLIKSAYKRTGFYIGLDDESLAYYIRTPRFTIWFNKDSMPNSAKAAVIEFAGELPGPGKEFLCSELDECNQYSFLGAGYDLCTLEDVAQAKFSISKLHNMTAGSRYMYSVCEGVVLNSILIPESVLGMIDPGAIDAKDGETSPVGPVAITFKDNQVFWYNDRSALLVKDVLDGATDEYKNFAMELARLENGIEKF